MNVYDAAHSLSQAVKGSEEYKQFATLKAEIAKNEELKKMVDDFQAKQVELQAKQMMGENPGEQAMQNIQNLYEVMSRDPLAAQYLQAQIRFSLMMKDVYEILGEVLQL